MSQLLSCADVSERLNAQGIATTARRISDLFYKRKLDASRTRTEIVGGVRLIPADYVPAIAQVIKQEQQIQSE